MARGQSSFANPRGPQPGIPRAPGTTQYIGSLMQGTVSSIALPAGEKLEPQMKAWTAQAYACLPETPHGPQRGDNNEGRTATTPAGGLPERAA